MKTTLLSITLLLGCAGVGPFPTYNGPTNPVPNQSAIVSMIWDNTYNASAYEAPPVVWRYNDTCNGSPGWDRGDGMCIDGKYDPELNYIQVEHTTDVISETGLEHELCHAYRQFAYGDIDVNHDSICFSTATVHYDSINNRFVFGTLVDAARQYLQTDGF